VDAPEGCKQHGCVWACPQKQLGWPWEGINGVRNKWSHLVGPPFPAFKVCFLAQASSHFSRVLNGSFLIGGCG